VSWWHALLLGLLQGVTEFLPVSSSGHLALAQLLIPGFEQPGVVFDAMLHVGTAAAVVWAERRHLVGWLTTTDGRRLIALLVVGTAATSVVAFPLRHLAESAFERALWVGLCLLLTGLIVIGTRWLRGGQAGETSTAWWQAAVIGLIQGMAVFPGISRSGTTIAGGLLSGLDRTWAARFSFLLSVPAIAGATLVSILGEREALKAAGSDFWMLSLLGGVAAAFAGYAALRVVIRTLASRHFHRFGWYCVVLGTVVVWIVSRGAS